jgi:hypothetical protein
MRVAYDCIGLWDDSHGASMADSTTVIRATAAGVGGIASVVAFLTAVDANPHAGLDFRSFVYAVVLVVPFAIYLWFVRTRRRSILLGLILCSGTAWWIVAGYESLRTTDDGLGFMYPYLAWIVTISVALLGGLYDRLTSRPPTDAKSDSSA